MVGARRDVRRYRPDPVPDDVLERVLASGHAAPSVGHSQPWRFLVVQAPELRERAAVMADRLPARAGRRRCDPDAARQLLGLQLEGIREAPVGVVVCCDRRAAAAGVLGRATFPDSDVWSCACAIQNMWLTARAEGLGLGWVTLFDPDELAGLLHLPDGVVTLGWLCLGWPDERPPAPGLERAGWSRRAPLSDVVLHDRWPASEPRPPPVSRLRAPAPPAAVVAERDRADVLLTPPSSLGVLDRAVDRAGALGLGRGHRRDPRARRRASPRRRARRERLRRRRHRGPARGEPGRHSLGPSRRGPPAWRSRSSTPGRATGDLLDADPLARAGRRRCSTRAGLGARLAPRGWWRSARSGPATRRSRRRWPRACSA